MNMTEKIDFLEKLRKEFPTQNGDYFSDLPRCTASDIIHKFNMSSEEVWQYIGELVNDGLIDNNGGDLRFNNTLYEDMIELFIIGAVNETINKCCSDVPIGFIFKVIRNMYRDDNFCSGKIANIKRDYKDVITEILNVKNNSCSK